jgi:diguanylate cyclase (GGDEF)-like protein/PAS domain S-box-containing protein
MNKTNDTTETSNALAGLGAAETTFPDYREIVEEAPCCLMTISREGRIKFINRYALSFLDRDLTSLLGEFLVGGLITENDEMEPSLEAIQAKAAKDPHAIQTFETRIHRPNGELLWLAWSTQSLFDSSGALVGFLSAGADISERKILESELTRLATTDPLTGAFNRRYLVEAGSREADRARRYDSPLSVMAIDIDFFKKVNDAYGHSIGDAVLQALTQLARRMLRSSDCFGRMGGEEFAVLLPQADLKSAHHLADRIRSAVQAMEIDTPRGPISITISIGVAQMSGPETRFDEALIRADKALYVAKQTGRNKVVMSPNLEAV